MRSLLTPNNGCSGSAPEGCDRRSCEVFLAEPIVPSALDSRAKTPLEKRDGHGRRELLTQPIITPSHPTPQPPNATPPCHTPTDTPTAPASKPSCCCSCAEWGSPELNVQRRDKSFFNNSNYKVDRQTHRQTDNHCITKYQICCEKPRPNDNTLTRLSMCAHFSTEFTLSL